MKRKVLMLTLSLISTAVMAQAPKELSAPSANGAWCYKPGQVTEHVSGYQAQEQCMKSGGKLLTQAPGKKR
jgi:hypothetical protein